MKDTERGDAENPFLRLLIRSDVRPHFMAFADFGRHIDEIADSPLLLQTEKCSRLDAIRDLLLKKKTKTLCPDDTLVAVRLVTSLSETGVTVRHALDLLEGLRQDASGVAIRSWKDLRASCMKTAAPCARHVLDLYGISNRTWKASDCLCISFQTLDHLWDAAEDYKKLGRSYIPSDILEKAGSGPQDLTATISSSGLRQAKQNLLDIVKPVLQEACRLPDQVEDKALRRFTASLLEVGICRYELLRKRDMLQPESLADNVGLVFAGLKGLVRPRACRRFLRAGLR